MPRYSDLNDESQDRDQPFTGDGRKGVSENRLPAKGEIVVRTEGGSALLKQTADMFDKAKRKGKHAR